MSENNTSFGSMDLAGSLGTQGYPQSSRLANYLDSEHMSGETAASSALAEIHPRVDPFYARMRREIELIVSEIDFSLLEHKGKRGVAANDTKVC